MAKKKSVTTKSKSFPGMEHAEQPEGVPDNLIAMGNDWTDAVMEMKCAKDKATGLMHAIQESLKKNKLPFFILTAEDGTRFKVFNEAKQVLKRKKIKSQKKPDEAK